MNRVDSSQDFKQWTTVFMLTNRSDYYGFALSTQIGWETTDEYDDETNAALNRNSSTLFFDVLAGF